MKIIPMWTWSVNRHVYDMTFEMKAFSGFSGGKAYLVIKYVFGNISIERSKKTKR